MMKLTQPRPVQPKNFHISEPLDLTTVTTVPLHESSPENKRIFGIPEAPTFYPTPEEWVDPMKYIESIKPVGEKYGICKIVPPEGWKPPFSLDTENFRFKTRIQKLNSMEGETRANLNYLEQLYKFHRQQGHPVNKIPQLDKRPIDLFKLKKEVATRGGYQKVCDGKKWAEVGRELGYTRKQCTSMSNALKSAYTRVVLPYEMYLAKQGKGGVKHPVDIDMMDVDLSDEVDGKGRGKKGKKRGSQGDLTPPLQGETEDSPPSPSRGEYCEVCKSGDDDEQILLCDGCDRGYHMYCLNPPLKAVPNTDWYCVKCLVTAGDDYGFEEGEEYSLTSFQLKAKKFKETWFSKFRGPDGRINVSEAEVEKEFWRLVENPHETVEVEYGADLHSTQHGSGFPCIERHPTNPYSTDPWNLNVMPVLPDSLFCHIKSDISGMMVPWLYVGMCFSTFCWHNEDHYTYSINYQHWGETKTWYGIPASDAERFEDTMRKAVPELFEQQPDLLFQLVTMLSPGRLMDNGVQVSAIDQRAGQFIITFPQAYHAGFNHGFNFNEAVNFAPSDWYPFGLKCVIRYQEYRKHPCFSHDELLVTTAMNDSGIKTAEWLKDALALMRDRELGDRNKIRCKISQLNEILDENDRPEEEYQCVYCNAYCYLSQIICECTSKVACILHVAELCKCDLSKRTLRKRFSDDAIIDMASRVAYTATVPSAWVSKLHKAMMDHPRPQLKVLRALLAEAEKIPVIMEEALSLKEFVDKTNEWVEEANRFIVRKHQNRRREKESSVGATGSSKKFETIQRLLEDVEQLSFDAPEIKLLQDSARAIVEFKKKAQAVLANPYATFDESKHVYESGLGLSIDLEEMEKLEANIRELEWIHKVKAGLDTSSLIVYVDIARLVDEAKECGIPDDHELLIELRKREAVGRQWVDRATEILQKEEMTMEELQSISEAETDIPVSKELLIKANNIYIKVREWKRHAASLVQRRMNNRPEDRPPVSELRKALKAMENVPVNPEELTILLSAGEKVDIWQAKARKLFAKGGNGKSFESLLKDVVKNIELISAKPSSMKEATACDNNIKLHINTPMPVGEPHISAAEDMTIGNMNNGDHQQKDDGKKDKIAMQDVYCLCRSSEAGFMIECDICHEWYHGTCVKVSRKEAKARAESSYICPICDVTIQLPRKRPRLEELESLLVESRTLDFYPSEVELITKIVEDVKMFRMGIQQFINESSFTDIKEIKDNLRKLEGLDVLLQEETDFLREKVRVLAPLPVPQITEEASIQFINTIDTNVKMEEDATTQKMLYCLCRKAYNQDGSEKPMIQCDTCQEWYHMQCVNMTNEVANNVEQYLCPLCANKAGVEYAYGKINSETPKKSPLIIKLTVKPPKSSDAPSPASKFEAYSGTSELNTKKYRKRKDYGDNGDDKSKRPRKRKEAEFEKDSIRDKEGQSSGKRRRPIKKKSETDSLQTSKLGSSTSTAHSSNGVKFVTSSQVPPIGPMYHHTMPLHHHTLYDSGAPSHGHPPSHTSNFASHPVPGPFHFYQTQSGYPSPHPAMFGSSSPTTTPTYTMQTVGGYASIVPMNDHSKPFPSLMTNPSTSRLSLAPLPIGPSSISMIIGNDGEIGIPSLPDIREGSETETDEEEICVMEEGIVTKDSNSSVNSMKGNRGM